MMPSGGRLQGVPVVAMEGRFHYYAIVVPSNNAGLLLKGAKKVPKGTLFFIGQNGQLYMRTGPYLEGDGKFMFGTN